MGCAPSKPLHRRSAAVALCRDRSKLLAAAIRHRYALADAHRAYAASLEATAAAMHDYLSAVIHDYAAPPSPPPLPAADVLPPAELTSGAEGVLDVMPPVQLTTGGEGADVVLPPAQMTGGEGRVVPPDEEEDDEDSGDGADGHILFPSESEEVDDDDEEGDDGHIQFPSSDEETEPPPIPPPQHEEHPLPQQALLGHDHLPPRHGQHPLLPRPERLLPQPDHPLLRRPEPLQQPQAAPLQMPRAPYGYAPPYTYGAPDSSGQAYAYGAAQMGTYGSGPAPHAYGTAYSPVPAYAYGGEMGSTYGSSGPAPHAYGAQMGGTYGGAPPAAYTYGGAETTGTYGPAVPAYAYGAQNQMGAYSPGGPAYAYSTDMSSSINGHSSFVSTMNYARSQPPPPSVAYYEHSPHATNTTVHYYLQDDGSFGPPPPSSYYYGGYNYQYPAAGGSFSPAAPSSLQPAPAPLPPPSPPQVSTWDFLNPLETFESYYYPAMAPNYMPSGSSIALPDDDEEDVPELEDEENVPELEDEEDIPELEDEKDIPPELEDEKDMSELEDEKDMPKQLEDEKDMSELKDKKDVPEQENEKDTPKLEDDKPEPKDKQDMEEKESVEAVGKDDGTAINNGNKMSKEEEKSSSANEELHKKSGTTSDTGNNVVTEEPQSECTSSLDKSLVEEQLQDSAIVGPPAAEPEIYLDNVEMVQKIKVQFDHVFRSAAGEVWKLLEVGKVPYKHSCSRLLKVPSRMICGLSLSGKKKIMRLEEEKAMDCGNLSSTLQKLYILEKKLLDEVEAEEKLRIMYDQKYEEAKRLFKSGAEAPKLEAVQIHTRKLTTKISVAIQAVKYTSNEIDKIRDEELWPQTHELIQGFMEMWRTMSECYQMQCQAMSQAKDMGSAVAAAASNHGHIYLVRQLELQLLGMTASFAAWLGAQRRYVGTLNEWLKRGIEYVPEVTDDGVAPFSPGRLDAPPVFTVYNSWATSMAMVSEKEVVDAMLAFASGVLGVWEGQRSEWMRRQQLQQQQQGVSSSAAAADAGRRRRQAADLVVGRELRSMRKQELSMRKALQAQKKKFMVSSTPPAAAAGEGGLQSCMQRSFEAMESFAAACARAYKDLHLRSSEEEEKARRRPPAAQEDQEDGAALLP